MSLNLLMLSNWIALANKMTFVELIWRKLPFPRWPMCIIFSPPIELIILEMGRNSIVIFMIITCIIKVLFVLKLQYISYLQVHIYNVNMKRDRELGDVFNIIIITNRLKMTLKILFRSCWTNFILYLISKEHFCNNNWI